MKSEVETLSPTRVKLTVEVPFEELTPSVDAAYRKVAGQIRIPGFRPGKVPARIVDQRIGRSTVLEEAVNEAIPQFYGQAVEAADVRVLSHPEIVGCYVMTGEMDYLLHVLVRDLEAYGHFTMAVLLKMPGVKDVKSSLALEVVKDSTALPLERMDDRPAIAGKRK